MPAGSSSDTLVGRVSDRLPVGQIRDAVYRATPGVLQRHYTAKFVVALLVVAVLIAGVGSGNYLQAKGTVESDARSQLDSTARLQAHSLGAWVGTMKSQTRTMSVEAGQRESAAAVGSYLSTAQSETDLNIRAVHYVDVDSDAVVASTNPSIRGEALSAVDQPWVRTDALSDIWYDEAPIVDAGFERDEFGERLVAFASPTPGSRSKVLVVVGSVDSWLLDAARPSAAHSIAIVDRGSETVVTATDNRPDGFSPGAFADRSENESTTLQRNGQLYAATNVPDTDWVLASGVPAERAFVVREAVGWNVLLTVLTGVLALALVGAALGQQTVPPLIRLREHARRMEGGDLDVDLETRRRDEIGRLFGAFASMRDSLRDQIERAETAREDAERERERTEELNRHLVETADEYSRVMQACADGDLTRRMDPESRSEAMVSIAEEFNDMVETIESTVASVTAFADEVATASEEVTASSEEVRSTSEQVSTSIQSISEGAERQNAQLRTVREASDDLSATIEEITSLSNEVAELAERTAETGREGRVAAEDAIDGMAEIREGSAQAVDAIEQLNDEIAAIDDLVALITDVAEQTNVLALNANIEAARAESGSEGFEVVANEVKELAEHTRSAATDIEERIETIQARTDRTATEIQQTRSRITENTDAVERAVGALEEISEYAVETNTGVQEITAATEQQSSSTDRVVSMVDDVAGISETTSEEAGHVAAAAEEQTGALNEVTRSMDDLSGTAAQLDETLSKFRTGADAAPGRPSAGRGGDSAGDGDEAGTPDGDGADTEDGDETGDGDREEDGAGGDEEEASTGSRLSE